MHLLWANHDAKVINLTHAFRRDLHWFNRLSIYKHNDYEVELDVCLDGLGAVRKNFVYHVPLQQLNLSIVHLEMVNILVAFRAFSMHLTNKSPYKM